MKTNKKFPALFALVVCLAFLSSSVNAQKRKPTVKRSTTRTTQSTASASLEIKSGAEKVSNQIKNVTKFIYVLGGVARIIEDLDKDIAAGKTSRGAIDQNNQNKQKVIQTIRNLRAGLAALEVEFRTKPALKNYLFQIQGITDISGNAEDQAASGQFVEAGKTLVLAVEKLADTLAALP